MGKGAERAANGRRRRTVGNLNSGLRDWWEENTLGGALEMESLWAKETIWPKGRNGISHQLELGCKPTGWCVSLALAWECCKPAARHICATPQQVRLG